MYLSFEYSEYMYEMVNPEHQVVFPGVKWESEAVTYVKTDAQDRYLSLG
jgi:hypothetical protein